MKPSPHGRLLLLIAILLSSCLLFHCSEPIRSANRAGKPPRPADRVEEPSHLWFALEEGRFQPIERIVPSEERNPWTVQPRVVDFARVGDRLFAAVNGYGVVEIEWKDGQEPRLGYRYERTLLNGRTVTRLLSEANALICHCYFNSQLNVVSPEEWTRAPVCLIRFPVVGSEAGTGEVVRLPFQEAHPQWELKTFYTSSGGYAYLEWKLSGQWRTEFSYSRLDLAHWREVGITREAFRRAYWSENIDDRLMLACRLLAEEMGGGRTYHFHLQSTGSPYVERFRVGSFNRDIWTIPVLRESTGVPTIYVLDPRGVLYGGVESSSGILRRYDLPPLPGGFAYTGLGTAPGGLIVSWEESEFTDVGLAGLLFIDSSEFVL